MEKQLTTEQSLDIIARMIATTRHNFNDRGGAMFLIWGYTTFFISPALLLDIDNYHPDWLWILLPVIGGVLTWLHYRKHTKPVITQLDRAVNYLWIASAAACLVCVVLDAILPMRVLTTPPSEFRLIQLPTLFILVLLGSAATATTGHIIKSLPVTIGGYVGMALSFLMVIYKEEPIRYLMLSFISLCVLIIPGHLLNAACKREMREADQNGRTV